MPDVLVQNEGTIWLFHLASPRAALWVEEHVPDPLWHGAALACEHRYAPDLMEGMMTNGLRVTPINFDLEGNA